MCTGIDGIDRSIAAILPIHAAWYAHHDPEPSPSPHPPRPGPRGLPHRRPGGRRLGDVRTVEWTAVDPVDVLAVGPHCQGGLDPHRPRQGARPRCGLRCTVAIVEALAPGLLIVEQADDGAAEGQALPDASTRLGDPAPFPRPLTELTGRGYATAWAGPPDAVLGARPRRFTLIAAANHRAPGRWIDHIDATTAGSAAPPSSTGRLVRELGDLEPRPATAPLLELLRRLRARHP